MKRFTKRQKGWKFDSSAIYNLLTIISTYSAPSTPFTISGMRMSMCCC
ncbi:hypothetical protein KL86DYS1_30678 [uncultured Dysgonomonas sp.]|uniref:Uncharacterized protein n=1 Tax=uncultured Dysgonomonas sp. TaxID=206096 RepID=A0A212JWU0_9BACT|nr:hypothetical protein KL86DYS1_30678 [uncultured Dysgonomonas sp.]